MFFHSKFPLFAEYDALSRLGISDGRQFLKRRFQKLPVQFLPTCCVGESLQDQVEAAVDEALTSGEWVDIVVSGLDIVKPACQPFLTTTTAIFFFVSLKIISTSYLVR